MEASPSFKAEEERLRRIRRQMQEQDAAKYLDPTRPMDRPDIYAMYAWRHSGWRWITVLRGKITPKRIARLRHKYRKRVKDTDVVRIVEMRVVRSLGPGAPPQLPPRSKRPQRLAKANRQLAQRVVVAPRRRTRTDPRLSKCEHRASGKRCSFRAPWCIGYTDTRTRRRVVRKRCGRHAWDDRFLPPHAKEVVRVARTVRR
jgi:hypothetical protein